MKENPGINVKLTPAPQGNPYTDKIMTRIAGGTPPDIMFLEVNMYDRFRLSTF